MNSSPPEMPPRDGTLNDWLAYVIRGKFDTLESLLKEKEGTLAMEHVHKLRVNARRLEAMLRVFEERFPRKKVRQLREEFRVMIRYLGRVREYDVVIDMLEKRATTLRAQDRFILTLVLANVARRQKKFSRRLRAYLAAMRPQELKRRTRELTAALHGEESPGGSRKKTEKLFGDAMREIIPRLFGEFMNFEELVRDHPNRLKEFHDMRVAGKPLRYMMEIVLPVAGSKAKKCLREIVAFLTEMGAIHDHDVAIETIAGYLDEVTSYDPAMKKKVGVLYRVLEEQRRRREVMFRRLCSTLLRWDRENFRSALIQSIA
jgi:CHAD domain-containing protein